MSPSPESKEAAMSDLPLVLEQRGAVLVATLRRAPVRMYQQPSLRPMPQNPA